MFNLPNIYQTFRKSQKKENELDENKMSNLLLKAHALRSVLNETARHDTECLQYSVCLW